MMGHTLHNKIYLGKKSRSAARRWLAPVLAGVGVVAGLAWLLWH